MTIDYILVGMVVVGALAGVPWLFGELRRGRMADPLDMIGRMEKRKEELERSIETPHERLERLRAEQKRLFQPNRAMFRFRIVQVALIFGGLAGLLFRHA